MGNFHSPFVCASYSLLWSGFPQYIAKSYDCLRDHRAKRPRLDWPKRQPKYRQRLLPKAEQLSSS